MAGAFNTSGTTEANKGTGFKLGTADLAGCGRGNEAFGNALTLYSAAAYCREEPIWYALALKDSAGGLREYAVRVAPAAGKVVSVVLPVNVTDGSGINLYQGHTQDFSAEMSIQNKSAFPVSVKVTGVTPVALGGHNVTKLLQLTTGAVNTGTGGSLESGNVKLYQTNIEGSAAASYKYDLNNLGAAPADPVVLGAQAGGTQGGTWKFRYLMEHGPAYSGGEETFGYQIVYELKLSAADAAAGTGKA